MPRAPNKTSAPAPLPESGADPPGVRCAPGSVGLAANAPAELPSAEPLASFEVPSAPGPVKVTVACDPGGILIRVAATSATAGVPAQAPAQASAREQAEACDTRTTLAEILRQIRAVAEGTYDLRKENGQLQRENEELRQMQARGLFDFVLDVEREDFLAFAVIMALGNRNAAWKFLEAPQRTFYDRLERWKKGSKSYRDMLRWVQWRRAVGRKIKLRLPDPNDSGSPDETATNPEVLHEVVAAIGASHNRDYPALLREILEVLVAQNPKNWESARRELVELIRDELSQ